MLVKLSPGVRRVHATQIVVVLDIDVDVDVDTVKKSSWCLNTNVDLEVVTISNYSIFICVNA